VNGDGAPASAGDAGIAGAGASRGVRLAVIFGLCAIGLFMVSVDQTIVATALVDLQRDLGAELQWGTWTISIYALGQVIVMPIAGKLSDMYGRKRVLLVAIAIFTVASAACGLSQNIYELIALRALQAIGGGAVVPGASGLVADHFGSNRDRALAMFSTIFPIGAVVGPILGGVFVTYASWRDIFFVNVPVGAALLVLGLLLLPRDVARRRATLDLPGVALLAGSLLAAMFGITSLGDTGSPLAPTVWIPLLLAAVLLPLFLRHTRRSPDSFIPAEQLFDRRYLAMDALNFFYGAAAIGFGAMVPLYARERYAVPALESGTLLTARAIGVVAVSTLTAFAMRRVGFRAPILLGHALIATGSILLFVPVPAGLSPYAWLAGAAAVTGLGMGMAAPAGNNAILHIAGDRVAGISGLRGMFRQAGSIVAISVVTAVVAQSAAPGAAFGTAFLVLGIALLATTPVVFVVRDHRGAW